MLQVGILCESFEVKESKDNSTVSISGIALPFGMLSRNGVAYEKESAIKVASSMVGAPLLWNHDDSKPPLGKVTVFEPRQFGDMEAMYYEAEIDPEEKDWVRKVKNKYIRQVSMQCMVDEENIDGSSVKPTAFLELSMCNIAGFPQTTITVERFAEKYLATDIGEKLEEGVEMPKEKENKEEDQAGKSPLDKKEADGEPDAGQPDVMELIGAMQEQINEMQDRIASLEASVKAGEEPPAEEPPAENKDEDDADAKESVKPSKLKDAGNSKESLDFSEATRAFLKGGK